MTTEAPSSQLRILGREEILAAQDLAVEVVPVPEWGENAAVLIRGLTGAERDAWEQETYNTRGKDVSLNWANARARLVARCIVDELGNRVFTNEDVVRLGKKSAVVLDRLFSKAQQKSGITKQDLEEVTKNSVTTPEDSSTSD
jgi:hypothetical protein